MTRPYARLAAAALALILAMAASARAQGAATPQAALDGLEAAIKAADAKAAMTFLTPAGQKLLAKDMVINGLAFLAFMDPDDPMGEKATGAELAKKQKAYKAAKEKIAAAMKPSGLDAAIGKPLMPAEKIVDEKLPGADPVTLVPAIFEAAKAAGPELGMKETPRLMKFGPITNLKVDGDKATVKSGPRTVTLEKVGGKWLINAPLPEPAGPPQ